MLTWDCNAVAKSSSGQTLRALSCPTMLCGCGLNFSKTLPALHSSIACLDPDTLLLLVPALGRGDPPRYFTHAGNSYLLTWGAHSWSVCLAPQYCRPPNLTAPPRESCSDPSPLFTSSAMLYVLYHCCVFPWLICHGVHPVTLSCVSVAYLPQCTPRATVVCFHSLTAIVYNLYTTVVCFRGLSAASLHQV